MKSFLLNYSFRFHQQFDEFDSWFSLHFEFNFKKEKNSKALSQSLKSERKQYSEEENLIVDA